MNSVETLEKLIELQSIDSGYDELEKHRQAFIDQLDLNQGRLTALKNLLSDEKKAQEALSKLRKTHEIEVGTIDNRLTRYQTQLDEVKSNKEYEALKIEIEKCKTEKTQLEEKVLETLFAEDEQKLKIQYVNQQIAAEEKKAAQDKQDLAVKIADCEKAMAEKKEQRKVQLAQLPEEYAEGYEAMRDHGKKIAVAGILESKTCGGCHMTVPPQVLMEVQQNNKISRCVCGRYLFLKD